ncbi:MAG: tellurite resistance/C4-dicarboxylate transporter family protein [Bacteroidota bacterium]|nr:tellurite resistance/C4-dicarboxylate transporter family protein [Bacteroidota bacterium]
MPLAEPKRLKSFLPGITNLSPAYFSLVMATGIVSIAAQLYNWILISKTLFWINLVAYIILCCLFAARLFFYTKEFRSDFLDDRKNMGFLSFTAANSIIGNQFVLIAGNYQFAICFFAIGLLSWVFLIYSLFAVLIEKRKKPSLKAINGTWLLIIVSTQSLSVLSGLLASDFPLIHEQALFFSLMMFLLGCIFYIIVITLILYRLVFFEINAEELRAPYWINMGADAISVLAGATLILNAGKWPFLTGLLPFLKGFTLFFWAIGTWWIPLMVVLGIWRHLIKNISLKYSGQYWGMVFPLGMYTVCTVKMSQAVALPFLMGIPSVFVIIAIVVWAVVFISMLYTVGCNMLKVATSFE